MNTCTGHVWVDDDAGALRLATKQQHEGVFDIQEIVATPPWLTFQALVIRHNDATSFEIVVLLCIDLACPSNKIRNPY
jgi:hypothetical protein